jgi:hypothetical protein
MVDNFSDVFPRKGEEEKERQRQGQKEKWKE